ncbi:MAG: transglutaminase family protein [Chloroflexota bacterium]|nr:MAG: transglutaminase family protein [Chloroflexota bacterium]
MAARERSDLSLDAPRHLRVRHVTHFDYSDEIIDTTMELRLRPIDGDGQRLVSYNLVIDPRTSVRGFADPSGNWVDTWNYGGLHRAITIATESVVETGLPRLNGPPPPLSIGEDFAMRRFDGPILDLPLVRAIADRRPDLASLDGLDAMTADIHDRFEYQPSVTHVHSTVADIVAHGRGVCQDFAHLWIAACRARGIPARYVSGYIRNTVPIDGAPRPGASHAWGEAWLPGSGWLGYDPTNWSIETRGRVRADHVRVATGRDYRDVPPTRGIYRGTARESLSISVTVMDLDAVSSQAPEPFGRR